MKTNWVLITIFLLSVIESSIAQVEFPNLDGIWCYSGYGDQGENLGIDCFQPTELVDVDGVMYTKIKYKGHPNWAQEEILYREEDKRFYVWPLDWDNETLVYDFNLGVGDAFEVNWGWGLLGAIELEVNSIDTITTLDGVKRARFVMFENESYAGTWIEGIGMGNGGWVFLFPGYIGSVSGGYNFVCHFQDEQAVISEITECGLIDNLEETNTSKEFQVIPNPVVNEIHIQLQELRADGLEIISSEGQLVFQQKFNQKQGSIGLSHSLNAGVYFVKIIASNGLASIQKIVVL